MWLEHAARVLFVVLPVVVAGGCKVNEAATKECKESPNAEACEACCKANDAKEHVFVSGSGCTCRE